MAYAALAVDSNNETELLLDLNVPWQERYPKLTHSKHDAFQIAAIAVVYVFYPVCLDLPHPIR